MMMIDLSKVLFMLAIVHSNLASLSFSSSYSSSSSSQLPALHFDIPSKLHPTPHLTNIKSSYLQRITSSQNKHKP